MLFRSVSQSRYTNGTVDFFYNGTTWVTTEPSNYFDPILINSINVKAALPGSDPKDRIAIIEVAAKLIKSINDDNISSIDIYKQTSSGNQDILPVGFVNSNTLTAVLIDFNGSKINYTDYNRYSSSFDS